MLAGVDDVPPGDGLWASQDGTVWERRHAFFRPDGSSAAGQGTAGEVVYAFVSQDHVFGSADEGEAGSEVVLYDLLGREVHRIRPADGITEVGVSGLTPGLYVVQAGGQAALVTVRR